MTKIKPGIDCRQFGPETTRGCDTVHTNEYFASNEPVMLFDPKKLRELFEIAAGPLVAIGALVGAVTAGSKWLTPVLSDSLDPLTAKWLAIGLPLLAAAVLLWAAYSVIGNRSKLLRFERFDLRVRKREDLLGREQDVSDLSALIDDTRLLLIDGESGSGKSSLMAFGLIPKLKETPSIVPILVDSYAGDWDNGLARKLFDASWSALSAEELAEIGFTQRPPVNTIDADSVRTLLDGIATRLGRTPIVIFDQFDDYQLSARQHFLGRRKDWIKPADLVRRNRTWAAIRDLLREEKARLLVITRSDASAGLHSIRLIDQPGSSTVPPLEMLWLVQWFDQVTADDGQGDVIANPDAGWTDLKRQLARDLTSQAAVSVVLPQQVRIVFLGLRKLTSLTLADYRRAASGEGIEALYIRDAIANAAAASGLSRDAVRELLIAFVDREDSRRLKTKVLVFSDIAALAEDAEQVRKALDRLKRDEVVRERPASGDVGVCLQLDHDYIARAIVAEHRSANILSAQLQDGNERWRAAGRNIFQRYRSLLPLSAQARLAWARVHSRQGFVYRPYLSYAAISALRVLPLVLVLVVAGWLFREQALRSEATQIVDQLNEDSRKGDLGALALWEASPAVRIRVVDRLLDSPGRLRDAGTSWVNSFVSIEPDAATYLARRLVAQLESIKADQSSRRYLIAALRSAGEHLDQLTAAEIVKELRVRLHSGNASEASAREPMVEALGSLGSRLNATAAAETAADLRMWLDGKEALNLPRSLLAALSRVSGQLDPAAAAETAKYLRDRLDNAGGNPVGQEWSFGVLASVGSRLNPAEAALTFDDLRSRLNRKQVTNAAQQPFFRALANAGSRLDEGAAADAVKDLRSRLSPFDPFTEQSLLNALAGVGTRLDAPTASSTAKSLIALLDEDITVTEVPLLAAFESLSSRLDASGAAEVTKDLRTRLDRKTISADFFNLRPLISMLGNASSRLDAATAAEVAKDLRLRLRSTPLDPVRGIVIISALRKIDARIDATAAEEAASDIRALLDITENLYARQSLIDALGSVGSRLAPADAAKTAKALRALLNGSNADLLLRRQIFAALGSIGGRLGATEAMEAIKDLRPRIDSKDPDPGAQELLIDALASLARLSGSHPTAVETAGLRLAMGSIAWPLREASKSPAWTRLETLSGENFDGDNKRLLAWLKSCCKLAPSAARPPFTE